MLKSIIAFFAGLFLRVRTFLAKHVPLAETLLQEFINSDEGKKLIEDIKKASDKKDLIKKVLDLLKEKALVLAENNPKLAQKILDYLEKKILASL